MNKILVRFIFLFFTLTSIVTAKNFIPLSSKSERQDSKPTITVVRDDSKEIVLDIIVPGFFMKENIVEGKSYAEIDLADDAVMNKCGYPALPFVSGVLSLAANTALTVESIKTGAATTFDNILVMPAQDQWEHKKNQSFITDKEIYNSNDSYPVKMVEIDSFKIKNGASEYIRIAIYPFNYIPSEKKLTVYNSLTVTFRKTSGTLSKITSLTNPRIDEIFENIIINETSNITGLQKSMAPAVNRDQKVLLIILPEKKSEYKTIVDEYAKWKHMSGVYTTVVTTAQTGSSIEGIKAYIKKAFEDMVHPLTDVILVGEWSDIPSKELENFFHSDNYKGCITGNDFIPEVFVARIPVATSSELRVVMKKMLMYEKTPYMDKTDWYKKAVMCANNDYESQAETKRTVASLLRDPGGYTVDTLMMKSKNSNIPNPTKENVISSLSTGNGILNYRGEGWTSGWAAYDDFENSDLNKVNNTNMLTFVTSIGCGVACWYDDNEKGFGQTFLFMGSEEQPRGAVTFIGPVSNTNTAYNNNIDRGLYKGLIKEGMETPSDVLLRGLAEMYGVFGANDKLVKIHYEQYTVLGDPTLRIYKDIPQKVEVTKPQILFIGQAQCIITVKNGGNPVKGVTVCGTAKSGIYAVAKTQENGSAILNLKCDKEEMITIVVKGNNVYPVIDSIPVTAQKNVYCAPDTGVKINDKATGNGDGILNPNEQAELEFTIKNYGTNTATGIAVSLDGPTSQITLNNNQNVPVGDIPSGAAQKITIPCKIAESCSAGTVIQLTMNIKAGSETYTFSISLTVQACKLSYSSLRINEIGANVNLLKRLDPGEKANLIITLANIGRDKAVNITGKISSKSKYLTITDSTGSFGTISSGEKAENSSDFFTVEVSSSCSTNSYITAKLELTTTGSYPYSTTIPISIPISVLNESDPTGPDSYGYYIIASSDTLLKNHPQFTWNEIDQKGVNVKIDYDMSYAREVVTLPFDFKFYGINYTKCVIHPNGIISFDGQSNISSYKVKIAPETDGFKAFISALGISADQLKLTNEIDSLKSEIFYYNDSQNKQFIIEYRNITTNGLFQIVLKDPSLKSTPKGDGEIVLYYKKSIQAGGSQRLVGIENENEKTGLSYILRNDLDLTARDIVPNTALLITTEKPELLTAPVISQNIAATSKYLRIHGTYPNPFISNVKLEYSIPRNGNVSICIYNAAGKEVKSFPYMVVQAGRHFTIWNGTDANGNRVGNGMYIVQVNLDGMFNSQKIFKTGR